MIKIETERYILWPIDDPYAEYWLENKDGEGMSVGSKELAKLIDEMLHKYFEENF